MGSACEKSSAGRSPDTRGAFAMDLYQLNQFCAMRNLVFIEVGQQNGVKGLWFMDYRRARRFMTVEEVNAALTEAQLEPLAL